MGYPTEADWRRTGGQRGERVSAGDSGTGQEAEQRLLSEEHFSVGGTLLEAWASVKSFCPKDEEQSPPSEGGGRNPEVDFQGERRSNETHQHTTDPEARLAKKGKARVRKRSCAL